MSDVDEEKYLKLKKLEPQLEKVAEFLKKHKKITYIEFDYFTVHDLTLFSMDLSYNFDKLEDMISRIKKVEPYAKKIFSKPIIELTDSNDVLPVESVKIINASTLRYLGNHTENVTDIVNGKIKPSKLLTRIYKDNYSIYENLIFCNFVDDLLKYLKTNINELQELIYANDIMQVNLLERVNHLNYFLALGKLQTSYIRDFDKYYLIAKYDLQELESIETVFKSRLKSKLYLKNKKRNRNLKLHKTNIFIMQKDYHQVYALYKYMKTNIFQDVQIENMDISKFFNNYFSFIKILTIFSIGHFNFSNDLKGKMDIANLDSTFTYKKWSLRLHQEESKIVLSFNKDKDYTIILNPVIDDLKDIKVNEDLDTEQIDVTPYEEEYAKTNNVFVSIDNIDSFRRISQLILKGMIYSDIARDDCPFCGGSLEYNSNKRMYTCSSCKTEIHEATCDLANRKYYFTSIEGFVAKNETVYLSTDDQWLYNRKLESSMFFRNITKINKEGKCLCPYCGEEHK